MQQIAFPTTDGIAVTIINCHLLAGATLIASFLHLIRRP